MRFISKFASSGRVQMWFGFVVNVILLTLCVWFAQGNVCFLGAYFAVCGLASIGITIRNIVKNENNYTILSKHLISCFPLMSDREIVLFAKNLCDDDANLELLKRYEVCITESLKYGGEN